MKTHSMVKAFASAILVAMPSCSAQVIDSATELRAPTTAPIHRAFGMHDLGMPDVIRTPNTGDVIRRETKPVSSTVLEQIGRIKESVPHPLGVH